MSREYDFNHILNWINGVAENQSSENKESEALREEKP